MLVCLEAAKGLAKRGWDVEIWTGPPVGSEGELLFEAWRNAIKVVVIPHMRREISPLHDMHAYHDLRAQIRRFRPDVVHSHSSKAGVLARFAAYSCSVPLVVHTCHGLPFGYGNPFKDLFFSRIERAASYRCSRIFCVASDLIERMKRYKVAPESKIVHLPWGLDFDGFEARDADFARSLLNLNGDEIIITLPARIAPDKGHIDAIRAFEQVAIEHPSARLLFLGDGPLRERIERIARCSPASSSIIFAGQIPRERVPHYLAATSIVLLPSYREGLPIVLAEGFIAGASAVAYDTDGVSELVIDGITGTLVKKGDIDRLGRALNEQLASNALRTRYSQQGESLVRAAYSRATMCDRLDAEFREGLGMMRNVAKT